MGWGKLKDIGIDLGLGVPSNQGIPLDKLIDRPRRRRRRRGSPDYAAIASGLYGALRDQLTEDELEEVELVAVEFARIAIATHADEEEEPPPRRKRRKRSPKQRAT